MVPAQVLFQASEWSTNFIIPFNIYWTGALIINHIRPYARFETTKFKLSPHNTWSHLFTKLNYFLTLTLSPLQYQYIISALQTYIRMLLLVQPTMFTCTLTLEYVDGGIIISLIAGN